MHEDSIREEFTHQSHSFAQSPAMSAAEILDALVELAPADDEARWLDHRLRARPRLARPGGAGRVRAGPRSDPGDGREGSCGSRGRGFQNVRFELGDATALQFGEASFDGAITRFSLHHIPVPARVIGEMARVVRPGGWIILGDHLTDEDGERAAWHQEIERLRDPTHWANQTLGRMRQMGEAAGLRLEDQRVAEIELDYDEWLERGSGGRRAGALIERLLAEPPGSECFRVVEANGSRRLCLRYWLSRWRRPGQS